jgi:hypothetical protein
MVITSWSTSLCHCSTAASEVFGPGGLWRITHAAYSVPLGPIVGAIITIIAVECCCRVVAMVATWTLVRWDRPTLEQEIASSSFPYPRREG